ncbi:hypothetical protein [Dickeya lacustris]|uniref:Uncharacterized protein n=1 Tax=Dickeya lacustris TaxID=2259638 RepID=A0ABY8G3W0_9GAMM|nr:hypothetical protein [Dickeya lacustris]WFN54635.1 hypothetical protein O1Q98_13280 [Dickeya lacustris]
MKQEYFAALLRTLTLRLLAVPLWQLLLLPALAILSLVLMAYGLWSRNTHQSLNTLEQQYQQHQQAIEQMRGNIARIPVHVLRRGPPALAVMDNTHIEVASLLEKPIRQSGVVLADWQPISGSQSIAAPPTAASPTTVPTTVAPTTAAPPTVWQLTLHTSYGALLNFLVCLNTLEVVLGIERVSLRQREGRLVAELQLSLPLASEPVP